jgi:hypothetical protein
MTHLRGLAAATNGSGAITIEIAGAIIRMGEALALVVFLNFCVMWV